MGYTLTILKCREGSIVRNYWNKASPKNSWANSKLCISMSYIKTFFRSPTPFTFVECIMLLPLRLVPLLVSSFPGKGSHDTGISNILGSLGNPGFNFTA